MFRLAVRLPGLIVGIEPYLNFYFQFLALSRYLEVSRVHCRPLKLEEMPMMRRCFDTVLCMASCTTGGRPWTRCGFDHIRCVDVSKTTVEEPRKTNWIDTQSLVDFPDPDDPEKTVEGYPAPRRAMLLTTAHPR
jgi:tRNA (mo5U34)-methyltransferase